MWIFWVTIGTTTMVQDRATKNGNKEELQEKREQVTNIKYFYKEDIHWYKEPLQQKRQQVGTTNYDNKFELQERYPRLE